MWPASDRVQVVVDVDADTVRGERTFADAV